MDDTDVAAALAALGHEVRLALFRLLVRAGPEGLNVGDLARLSAMPPSTLAHHLGALVAAGLVEQEKRGREVLNRAAYERLRAVLAHVEADCCRGVARAPGDAA